MEDLGFSVDKEGFQVMDEPFQEALKKEKEEIPRLVRQEAEEAQKKGGYKFHSTHPDWMIGHYPYSEKQREKALTGHKEALARRKAAIQAEVQARLKEKRAILEQKYFGKQGRQHVLEQMQREEKILAFKERERQRREQVLKTTEQSKVQAQQIVNKQKSQIVKEQDNVKEPALQKDFNAETKQGKFKADLKVKTERFKARVQEELKSGPEKQQETEFDQKTGSVARGSGQDKATLREAFKARIRAVDSISRSGAEREGEGIDL